MESYIHNVEFYEHSKMTCIETKSFQSKGKKEKPLILFVKAMDDRIISQHCFCTTLYVPFTPLLAS